MGFLKRTAKRWPNGVIPLKVEGIFVPRSGNSKELRSLQRVTEEYKKKTAIEFVEWEDQENYVKILDGWFGPWSVDFDVWIFPRGAYGMDGGQDGIQYVEFTNLSSGSIIYQTYIILHELGHVVGLYHEHQRPDRDGFVTVDSEDPFNHIKRTESTAQVIDSYDCTSVMNYYSSPVSSGPNCSASTFTMPQKLSPSDIKAINFLYPTKTSIFAHWSRGWIATKPVYLNPTNPTIFWYLSSSKFLAISTLMKGKEEVHFQTSWPKEISNIISFEMFGKAHVLRYDKSTGNASIFRLDNNPPDSLKLTETWNGNLPKNLTHIEYFLMYRSPHLLVYSHISKTARIYAISPKGEKLRTRWRRIVWKEWDKSTLLSVYSRNGTPYLFAYQASNGKLSYTKISYDSVTFDTDWQLFQFRFSTEPFNNFASRDGVNDSEFEFPNSPGWNTYLTYEFKGSFYLLLVKKLLATSSYNVATASFLQFWKLTHTPNTPWELIGETTWSNNWDTFIPYISKIKDGKESRNELLFVAYKSALGDVEFGKIHAM